MEDGQKSKNHSKIRRQPYRVRLPGSLATRTSASAISSRGVRMRLVSSPAVAVNAVLHRSTDGWCSQAGTRSRLPQNFL
jgi:hypothetical protein